MAEAYEQVFHSLFHQRKGNATCPLCGRWIVPIPGLIQQACIECGKFVEPVPMPPCPFPRLHEVTS